MTAEKPEPRAAGSDDATRRGRHDQQQPDPAASSDGDGSWTEDPITADPHEDRSVQTVIERTSGEP